MGSVIQGLKRIKHLNRRITTTRERINRWCSYMSDEDPLYTDINAMIQSAADMQTEVGKIRHAIHVLNATAVVEFKGKNTTLDELLLEATVVIPAKIEVLQSLRRKEKNNFRQPQPDVKVIIQYDPAKRDKDIDALTELQSDINDFLDTMNVQLELKM